VCDGMGGHRAGALASRIAADAILDALEGEVGGAAACADGEYLEQTNRLGDAVRRSNRIVYEHARENPDRAGMGTTMVGAWIEDHVASVAHVGDSRAYLWRQDLLEPLTRDHSLVELQVRAGVLSRDESGRSAHQHVLVRVLGHEPDVEVELNEVPVREGDYLLLCTDGLTRMVAERAMADAIVELRDPQAVCDRLIDEANRNGGRDNITLVVVELRSAWWRRVADRWTRRTGDRHGHASSAG
jgi:protein phosphatase